MEDILIQMNKDASSPKFSNIRKAVKDALDILNDSIPIPTYQLRQLCLEPLKLSLESKNKKLSTGAVAGIQQLLQDERFVSQIESENENDWLPIQVLSTVFNTPNLSEDYQVEILKLLLRMSFSRDWCVNASIITKVSQVYVETYMASAHTVQGIIKATLTQLLSSFTDKIHNSLVSDSDVDDVMSDFNAKESADNDLMFQEVVAILKFFTNKLENSLNNKQYRQAVPLLLEGVQTLISSCPPEIRHFVPFQEILWKSLCPCLISLLGTPKSERSAFSPNASAEDIGRGSGCSLSAPNIHNSTAKTIYSISVGLVEKIGPVCSMHPVLESLFHRMLLYPPPEHRLDAIRAVKELLGAPKSLYNLACPTIGVENQSKNHLDSDISLLKIIVDSLKESCRSGESSLCTLSVTCMNELLNTLELCCKGTGITVPIGNAVKARDTLLKNALLKGESIEEKDLLDRKTSNTSIDYEAVERENANKFVSELNNLLPQLLQMTSSIEIDETLQEFASTFCSVCYDSTISNVDNNQETCDMAILNADGVYIATIYTLLLCLNTEDNVQGSSYIKKSLKEFQEDVLGSGLLLFVSPSWLEEVYSLVTSPGGFLKKNCVSSEHLPLMSLLKDIDGLGSHKKGGQLLAEYYENDDIQDEPEEARFKTEMGKLFAKRVLGKCWDGILEVCSVLLTEKTGGGISNSLGLLLGMEGAKEESIRAREAVCMSLESLQKSARLCCMLGLQQRCGSVFSILASTSCTLIESQTHSLPNDSTNKPKPMKIHASHVLSLDVVMTNGLEMGSHSADCWRHVFRCSAFISELEHTYFSKGDNQSNLPKLQQEQASVENIGEEDEMFGVEVGSVVPVAPGINIPELIRQSSIESGWERSLTGGGVLNHIQASKALCGLSQEVDRLFEEAAQKLNLKALVLFLSELCYSSHRQLGSMKRNTEENETFQLPNNALHIYRLQEVLMKVVNSNRPLIHIMRVWGTASSHLVEAAGHRERNVSKMAVTCVHDFIVAMLCNRPELPYFHVNELLCKTFENMLCLELCDGDVQDQIVCSICELVEACTADIKSGWRPLFGALRAVKIEYTTNEEVNEARQRHVAAVLDVFEVYLNTDNILVFANATVDCILCLLKYVRGPGEFEMDASDDDSISGNDFEIIAPGGQNLCIPALSYLRKCSDMLQKLWKMPACPVFNGAHRIKASSTQRVDSVLPLQDIKEFSLIFPADEYPEDTSDDDNDDDDEDANKDIKNSKPKDKMKQEREFESLDFHGDSHNPNVVHLTEETDSINDFDQSKSKNLKNDEKNTLKETSSRDVENHCENTNGEPINLHQSISSESTKVSLLEGEVTLDNMDDNSGILHVWYLMIDGLSESVSSCLKTYQPDTLEMLFDLLRSVAITPGPRFALFCVNRVLLPMIQIWLRSGIRKIGYWQSDSTNFRQCCGMSTDLVVDFIQKFSEEPAELNLLKETMLKQLLDIMIECISQPVEVISRLGCSCIRHVVISSGKMFTETMWQISSDGISRAVDVTTHHIQQLMVLFQPNSENFYGDVGVVKVAMRHDCTLKDYQRVLHIATQVFLLDSQLTDHIPKFLNTKEPKAFSFLLYPPGCENCNNLDNIVARIPFQDIVVGLLSQQLLLQTIGTVLLGNDTDPKSYSKTTENLGMVPNMSTRNVLTLLKCLKNSNNVANMFDSRPGLKFLLQKVIGSDVAVNLYKQSGASMVLYINALLQICSRYTELSRKTVRQILAGSISSSINTHLEESSVLEPVSANRNIFLGLLHTVCNELCQIYVNMLSDDTLDRADKLAEQNVFFLIAQPDELSDLVPQRLGKKSSSGEGGVDQALDGLISLESVSQQEDVFASPEEHNELEDDPADFIAESNYSKQIKSKRERREEQNSKVYTLATDNLIKTLMTQYKKRKNYHSMPTFIKINKQPCPKAPPRKFSADEAIEKQHQSSIMKDSEARMMSLTELLCNILGLFQQLPDPKFEALLPLIFHCVNQLFYHAQEGKLKDALAQWLYKVGQIMQLSIN